MIPFMRQTLPFLAAAGCVAGFASCVHTPPGTSVEVALAKKAELVRFANVQPPPSGPGSRSHIYVPPVEPLLPENDTIERVSEATSRADFLMQTGNEPEAIAAYEEAVQIDPNLAGVWQTLAGLYEKNGQTQKAIEAAKRAKKLARH
jgi:tetratricopeptide (TPR) repeat protein